MSLLACLLFLGLASTYVNAILPFQNISLSWEDRVDDLVSRLTLDELVGQMAGGGGSTNKPSPEIPRLGIRPYQLDTECLHGVMNMRTTTFPQAIGLSASFSEDIVYLVAEAIGTEARALNIDSVKRGDYRLCTGMSCLAPFINLVRNPLWGRVQEVYGEDPYLSGVLAAAYVKGLQGNHPRYFRASSGCKVVGLYSGPENIPVSRFGFNAVASERDLRLSYFPQFKACIDANTQNLMCSYYRVNGIPGCTHKWLLTDVMRKEYGFKGYYITDAGALNVAVDGHHYFKTTLEAAAAAANAGVNLELPGVPNPPYQLLGTAVAKGMVNMSTLAELVKPLFYTRMRLGEFDPPELNPYANLSMSVIESKIHQEIAIQAAMKTYVLLKNKDGLLPLKAKVGTLAILGPLANDLDALYGNYNPVVMPEYAKTPLQGLKDLASTIKYASGCDDPFCNKYNSTAVKSIANSSDLVIVCLGTNWHFEGEGADRSNLNLPGHQLDLLTDASSSDWHFEGEDSDRSNLNLPGHQSDLLTDAISSAKRPVILLLFTGGPFDISLAKNSDQVGAILHGFFPAQAAGESLSRVLAVGPSGSVVSPAGRSPYTWPKSLDQIPPMVNYSMEGRTYRYFKGPGQPLYPFGYGLSYAKFSYANLVLNPATVKAGSNVTVNVTVTNSGPYNSDEVVQVYISWRNCPVLMPQRQLVAVSRQLTTVNQPLVVSLTIHAEQMRVWDDEKGFTYIPGVIDVFVGGQQPNQETSAGSNVLQGQIKLTN